MLPCRLCEGDEGDCIEHLLHCSLLIICLASNFPCIATLLGPVRGVSRSLLKGSLSRDVIVATVTGYDLLVHTIAAPHLGWREAPPEMLLVGRLRAVCWKAPAVAKLLWDHRST